VYVPSYNPTTVYGAWPYQPTPPVYLPPPPGYAFGAALASGIAFAAGGRRLPGRHDGLYWPAGDGEDESPLQPLVAQAQDEGYPGQKLRQSLVPYQGYLFRILFSQGAEAPGGAKQYVQNGRMTGGFALLAWPESYTSSGIMSFIVDQDGVVFQKDLGPQTARSVASITQFNSDPSPHHRTKRSCTLYRHQR
jgi:Protein of unknown function (DUF2950)/Protein of unknown function (DUF3300)